MRHTEGRGTCILTSPPTFSYFQSNIIIFLLCSGHWISRVWVALWDFIHLRLYSGNHYVNIIKIIKCLDHFSYDNTITGNYCHSTKVTNRTVGAVVTPSVKHENKGGTRSHATNVAPSGGVIYLSVPR